MELDNVMTPGSTGTATAVMSRMLTGLLLGVLVPVILGAGPSAWAGSGTAPVVRSSHSSPAPPNQVPESSDPVPGGLRTASGPPATPAPVEAPIPDEATAYLDQVDSDLELPGLAVRVSGAQGSWTSTAGRAADGAPFDADTPVVIGSVSKPFTATVVLRQAEQGRLDLDGPVSGILDWFPHDDVTVRDLLRHTSGYDMGDGLAVADRFDTAPGALERAGRDVATGPRSGQVGTFSYSDANYVLLGVIVEQVSGRPFAEALDREVTAPLGLTHTGATSTTARTAGFRSWFGQWRAFDPGYDTSGAPYGYVVSTLADLDRFAAALHRGQGLSLTEADRASMALKQADAGTDFAGQPMWYGYGLRGGQIGGHDLVEHIGATPATFTHVLWLPRDGVRVVVVANGYSRADELRLANIARDLALFAVGEDPLPPAASDPLLGRTLWLLVGLIVVSVPAGVAAVRVRRRAGPRPSWVRVAVPALLALAVGLATLCLLAPSLLFGLDGRIVRLWAPDVGWSLLASAGAWGGVAALALYALLRHRRRPSQTPRVTESA